MTTRKKIKLAPARAIPAVTEGVFHALLRTWGLLRQAQDPYFARFGISASQWGILRVLQRADLHHALATLCGQPAACSLTTAWSARSILRFRPARQAGRRD